MRCAADAGLSPKSTENPLAFFREDSIIGALSRPKVPAGPQTTRRRPQATNHDASCFRNGLIVGMEYVNLGSTGLKVSRLCLGAMTYGSKKWREWILEEEESRPFIQRALELGINFFDTADVYSLGASEEILGRALKDLGPSRDKVVVATKVFNAMGDDPNQRAFLASTSCTPSTTACGGSKWITSICTRFTDSTIRRAN